MSVLILVPLNILLCKLLSAHSGCVFDSEVKMGILILMILNKNFHAKIPYLKCSE